MAYTRQQFVTDVLRGIGNNTPSGNIIGWMVAWTVAETGHPSGSYQGASYNLLNTTQPAPGTTNFNSIGVKNYTSYAQGIAATVQTLQNGYYPALLAALQTNNQTALGFGGSPSPGVMANLNTWCGSCGYGNAFVMNAGAFSTEVFAGTPTNTPVGTPPPQGGIPPTTSTGGTTPTVPPSKKKSGGTGPLKHHTGPLSERKLDGIADNH